MLVDGWVVCVNDGFSIDEKNKKDDGDNHNRNNNHYHNNHNHK